MAGSNYHDVSFIFQGHFSRLVIFLREGYRQAGRDWRAGWRRGGLWLLSFCWIVGLILTFAVLCVIPASHGYNTGSACQPDGSFTLDPSAYQYWSGSGLFQITLGFGNLTFSQAKAIDIIWDVFFGRGGQGLLGLISWRVFANYVTTSMEVTPVTFRTYRTVFLQDQSLIFAIPRMVKDFTRRHGLHSKVAMVFMVMTMVFILAFPTFGSAMTGYSGNVKAFVADANSQLIPFEDFSFALYNIHNGWKINRGGEYIVASANNVYGDPVLYAGDWEDYNGCDYYYRVEDENCQVQFNITAYTTQYGFSSSANTSSAFMNITVPGPVLNISYFYLPGYLRKENNISNEAADKSRMTWVHSNVTYPIDYIKTHGSCQPLLDYRWGFSYIQLFFMVIFLFIWSIGIYTLWLRTHIIMKRRDRQDVAGETKAVFELADAMRLQLEEHGVEEGFKISTLPESRLRHRIAKNLRGGTISYKTSLLQSGKDGEGDSGWGFKTWVKREKYWLAGFFGAIAVMLASVLSSTVYTATVTYGLPLEIVFTMYMGTKDNSRVVIFLWSFIILSVFPQIVVSIVLANPGYGY